MFKICPMCKVIWRSREEFLRDESLEINGYQVNFIDLDSGLFHFTHKTETCGTTMVVEVSHFIDLNPGKRYQTRKTGDEECPGYCLKKTQLASCVLPCECVFVRDLIQIIRDYKDGD